MVENPPHRSVQSARRIARTRLAIVQAFRDMVFNRRYNDIRVGDIVHQADIGRSTFYMHFSGKADVLIAAMDGVLSGLASCAAREANNERIGEVLEHIWTNRGRRRNILAGRTGQMFEQALAHKFEQVIADENKTCDESAFLVPAPFVANQLAASTLSLLQTWLTGIAPATSQALSTTLRRTSRAIVEAALEE